MLACLLVSNIFRDFFYYRFEITFSGTVVYKSVIIQVEAALSTALLFVFPGLVLPICPRTPQVIFFFLFACIKFRFFCKYGFEYVEPN